MGTIDYFLLLLYFAGLLFLGYVLSKRIKSSKDLFIAGRSSSWWLSGLSTYMTIFSASTFVVWGGVAYRSGMVAVVIGMVLGVASIFVGRFVAGKWSQQGINSPAEYLGVRFNQSVVRFYTIVGIIGRGVHMAVGLYAISIMAVALIPLPASHPLADPQTGHLSDTYAVLILGLITIIYTAAGGFLAVLMTDVVQFAVLFGMILIMVPLSLNSVGGIGSFIDKAPEGFFSLFSDQYSWGWMVLWLFLNFFTIGGDWAFVQRYISVPSPRDARKSAYLVGILYLVTPIIWYTPTLMYRTINPDANPEQAYMMMSQAMLGVGMLGMMLAAMISATLSTVSGTLNVFANVFSYDIFRAFRPGASDRLLIIVGRVFTYAFGVLITLMAVMIPYFGGAEKVVVPILTLVISPLFIPSVWGLFSRRISAKGVWVSMIITYLLAIVIKAGLVDQIIGKNVAFVDALIGFIVPFAILVVMEIILWKKEQDAGWLRVLTLSEQRHTHQEADSAKNKAAGRLYSSLAVKIMMGTYAVIGIIMAALSFAGYDQHGTMMWYGLIFLAVSVMVLVLFYRRDLKLVRHKSSLS